MKKAVARSTDGDTNTRSQIVEGGLPRQIVVQMAFLMSAPSRAPGLSERPPSPRPPSRRMRGCLLNVDCHLKGVSQATE